MCGESTTTHRDIKRGSKKKAERNGDVKNGRCAFGYCGKCIIAPRRGAI